LILVGLGLIIAQGALGQFQRIHNYVSRPDQQYRWLMEYTELLSIPNVLGDSLNMQRNARYLLEMLRQRGVDAKLLEPGTPRSAPAVYGEVRVPGATKTLALYAHYDGQPVNPRQWAEGLSPFEPVLYSDRLDHGGKPLPFPAKDEPIDPRWRLYARSASDDKAGVFAIIAGYSAMLAAEQKPHVNLKFFFEGEEEAGSVHLNDIFLQHKDLLQADLWVICDGPRHVSGRKQILFGVRGDVNIDLTVYGAKRPLHSGNYGNWAPNPAMRLVQLLATMKDADGTVTISGFYDDVTPLTEEEIQAIARIPAVEAALQKDLALSKPDGAGKSLMELMTLPTLNINGIQAANIGPMAANIIPTEATAVLDLRLVLGNDVDRQIGKVVDHIRKQGYHVIDHAPSDEERMTYPLLATVAKRGAGYNAQRTPMSLPLAQEVVKAVQTTVPDPVIIVPSLGGSLPLYLFEKTLGTKPITVPVVNYDNNQHGENENVMLRYLWEGIETMAAIMSMK
jgi:acetylornithine deacetylase/succinyl-diaminopimelate desuccinylase-like protein